MCIRDRQFRPVMDLWKGVETSAEKVLTSPLFHSLCGGVRICLTQCRRACMELFNLYCSAQLHDLPELREKFPYRRIEPGDMLLCLSHKTRIAVNAHLNRKLIPHSMDMVVVEATKDPHSQEMILSKDTPLFCIKTDQERNIWNGMITKVDSVHPLVIEGETYTPAQVAASFRLGYAQTYNSAQGASAKKRVTLFDTGHPRFSRRHLLVGMSRSSSLSNLAFAPIKWTKRGLPNSTRSLSPMLNYFNAGTLHLVLWSSGSGD